MLNRTSQRTINRSKVVENIAIAEIVFLGFLENFSSQLEDDNQFESSSMFLLTIRVFLSWTH